VAGFVAYGVVLAQIGASGHADTRGMVRSRVCGVEHAADMTSDPCKSTLDGGPSDVHGALAVQM